MSFYADLHIHSKHSRATSKDCDLEHLTYWGRKKGITVIGTGDFTHPAWFKEIQEKLVPAEPGLFRLKPDLEKKIFETLPGVCHGTTRFMLSVEISTIYKKGDKVRKIHHLVYAPSFEKAETINRALEKIGNIRSDGRPILGLDSRHLLEIVLEAGDDCYIVPAHIWTPWFAVLGSKSGFDSVAECYADLADHVFAVETGLSSDPEMNWRVKSLDRYRLMSNSDAHSPAKLGREVCVFDSELDYYAMRKALQTGSGYGGTLEFFPEEGKYHLDGHRNCGIRFTPEESKAHQGICPVCKKPLTLGVLYRVHELATRPEKEKPESAADFKSIIPLPEMISEIVGSGPSSQAVSNNYEKLLNNLGSELSVLNKVPLDQIQKASSSLFSEAISRMRQGEVIREAGYDGKYGKIKLFRENELKQRGSMGVLFDLGAKTEIPAIGGKKPGRKYPEAAPEARFLWNENALEGAVRATQSDIRSVAQTVPEDTSSLDKDQQKALEVIEGPLLIIAGPGSGKTRTLTHRVAHLIQQGHAKPEECLTITFTRRAAQEMKERLAILLPKEWKKIPLMTFHALAFQILEENRTAAGLPHGFEIAKESDRLSLLCQTLGIPETKAKKLLREVSMQKRISAISFPQKRESILNGSPIKTFGDDVLSKTFHILQQTRDERGWLDYDDLMIEAVKLLEEDAGLRTPEPQAPGSVPESKDSGLRAQYRERFKFVSIDEYQDMDPLQYRLIQLLVPTNGNLCAIGDPDQAIYGFRGADVEFFLRFEHDFPGVRKIRLLRNYRSGSTLLSASNQMIAPSSLVENRQMEALLEDTGKVVIHHAPTEKAEAEFVVHTIEKMIGGTTFFSMDSARSDGGTGSGHSFSDFAVLFRTADQAGVLQEAFARSGIPFELLAEEFDWDARADRVSLLTLHAAKGLEFPVVFIAGCEEGLIPLHWGGGISNEALAEERRLLYVGMTRAKEKLFLSHAAKRFFQGKPRERGTSPFLKDIEERLLEKSKAAFKKKIKSPQLDLL